jgi:hypothetical protein
MSETIRKRRLQFAGNCLRWINQPISKLIFWLPPSRSVAYRPGAWGHLPIPGSKHRDSRSTGKKKKRKKDERRMRKRERRKSNVFGGPRQYISRRGSKRSTAPLLK